MALCKLCLTIPFENLPPFPESPDHFRVADQDDMPELWYGIPGSRKSRDAPKDPLGFPYHQNFSRLEDSAVTCSLCRLVQAGVLRWKELHGKALRTDRSFAEFRADKQPFPEKQRLWLTRRPSNSKGFVVLARNPTRLGVYLLAGVSFGVKAGGFCHIQQLHLICTDKLHPGTPLASKIPLRPVEVNSGTSTSLDKVKSWLEDCVENHEQSTSGDPSLPSRVLDISPGGNDIQIVSGLGCSGDYACLSYCWGSSRASMLTKDSISARKSSITLSELPRTIFDAVLIARHLRLGYLWVDSLCICQDDLNDWAQQSALMKEIYSNAHLVIAANHANDKSVGCFHDRTHRPTSIVEHPGLGHVYAQMLFPAQERPWSLGDELEPLSQRGWALQERLLSRRTIHYNARQMCFECDHGIVGEDGSGSKSRYCDLRNPEPSSPLSDFFLWNSIVRAFGRRKLSEETDRLPAMSGLASKFQARFRAQYVAGLWSHELIRGLAWQSLQGAKAPSQYTGPSWSWAGFDGCAAGITSQNDNVAVARVVDWHVELKEDANPFGEVKDACLLLHGPVVKLTQSKTKRTEDEIELESVGRTPYPRYCTKFSIEDEGSMVRLDYKTDLESRVWLDWEMHVVLLQGELLHHEEQSARQDLTDSKKASSITLGTGLVIGKKNGGDGEQYQRVGWMFLEGREATSLRDDEKSWRTVKLI
ncbi:heterokaryon incompatibility protein-domain-containing protein [Phyllosticta citriasiana]|uniref:Heterokaryon incompatibility protein-domain-containing protein n=1 Tax=Phyllosticta citriasiana TaxID=595635 RepID=A0ABR1KYQ8_9PEZI